MIEIKESDMSGIVKLSFLLLMSFVVASCAVTSLRHTQGTSIAGSFDEQNCEAHCIKRVTENDGAKKCVEFSEGMSAVCFSNTHTAGADKEGGVVTEDPQ